MKNTVFALVSAFAVSAASADVHRWVGGTHAGGGWNTPTNWENENGENECPSPGDTALLDVYTDSVTANDADAALVDSLAAIKLDKFSYGLDRGAEVIFDFDEEQRIGCAVHGAGTFRKRGAGVLYLTNTVSGISVGGYENVQQNYWPLKGMIVEEGTVWCPQNSSLVFGTASSGFEIWEGAAVYLPNGNKSLVQWLRGNGTLAVDSDKEIVLQVGMASETAPKCVFGGKLTGNLRINTYAGLTLIGTESDFNGVYALRRGPGDHMNNGYVEFARLGNPGEASSVGTGTLNLLWSSCFRYCGTGETSTKTITYSTQMLTGTSDNAIIFDGGPTGGLELQGDITLYNRSDIVTPFVFCGSNAVPCTVAGAFKSIFYTPYVVKRGPGIWRFADNAGHTHAGVFDVEEGTLQFDSIAEAGQVCALGFATNLFERYSGAFDESKREDYAYRLGSPGVTNAVFEYTGTEAGFCSTRPAVLAGDAHIRASGAPGAPLDFSGVRALSSGAYSLTLDGTNTDNNVLRELSDGAGAVSLVKDGPGNWTLAGNHVISGSLSVKEGELTVAGAKNFTYFRVTFNDGYGSPHLTYVAEVALYDVNGVRRNRNLAFNLPAGNNWKDTYHPKNKAPGLSEGEMSYDGSGSEYYYLYDGEYALTSLVDGTDLKAVFSRRAAPESVLVVSMRLPDDTPEIAYFDFVQTADNYEQKGYQTPSAFVLEGSADGTTWTTLASTNGLELVTGGKWRFSAAGQKLADHPDDRDVASGEGLPFTTRAVETVDYSVLENVSSYSVAAGAVLKTAGEVSPVISKLEVDVADGIGTIKGFTFADKVEVNVTGIPDDELEIALPFDFSGCEGLEDVEWSFTADGKTGSHVFIVSKNTLRIYRRQGLKLIVR